MHLFRFFFVSLRLKIQQIMTNNQQVELYNRIKVVLEIVLRGD